MQTMVISRLALSFSFALASTLSLAADEMPWSFNSKRAEGYSIDLVLFVPLQPEGLKVTDGEVVIRYPIKKK